MHDSNKLNEILKSPVREICMRGFMRVLSFIFNRNWR